MKKKFVLVLLSFILLFPIAFSEVYSNEEFEYTVNENGTVDILYFIGASEDIIIPDTLENLPVTNIDDCAFFSISSLKTVVIPEGVTSIKWMAFSGCENLTAVVIPDSVTEIDSSAFSSCDKLTLIVNPDSYAEAYCSENNLPYDYELSSELAETPVEPVEEENKAEDNSTETPIETQTASLYEPPIPIENGAIYQAESDPHFKYVVNTDGTITVTEFVSKACTELGCDCKGITVPSVLDKHMVTGLSMFYTWPEFLEIPETIIYIDDRTLLGACMEFRVSPFNPVYTSMNGVLYNRLTRSLIRSPMQTSDYVPDAFSIPNGTLSIGDNAFLWTSYSNVLIPDSVVSIGKGAFDGMYDLDTLNIPASVISIKEQALNTLRSTVFSVAEDNPVYSVIDGVVFDKIEMKLLRYPGLSKLIGPESIEQLEQYELTTYTVPSGIKTIECAAFEGSKNLSSIYLPPTIKRIENFAFAECQNLNFINIPKEVDYIGEIPFWHCDKVTIEVVSGSYAEQYCIDHDLNYVSVTDPICFVIEGEEFGHNWKSATCTEPRICTLCSAVDGIPLEHDWNAATCTSPKTCTTCSAVEGNALGHSWRTIDELSYCTVCGHPNGKIVYINPEKLSSTWTNETVKFTLNNGKQVECTPLLLNAPIKECYSVTLCLRIDELISGNIEGEWGFYIRDLNGKWHLADTFILDGNYVEAHLDFNEPVSFDAWACPCHVLGDSWSFSFTLWLANSTVFEYNDGI